jgi:hypothetical protein
VGDRESTETSESDSEISLKGELGSLFSEVYAIVKGGSAVDIVGYTTIGSGNQVSRGRFVGERGAPCSFRDTTRPVQQHCI